MTEPRTELALEFLQRVRPGGPWELTAVLVDKKGAPTATVRTLDEAEAWLRTRNGRDNLYWSVGRLFDGAAQNHKASKRDVEWVDFLHVDVDPRKINPGEADRLAADEIAARVESEQVRILAMLRAADPAPSIIVFSGGGYQAFWRLAEPIHLDGTVEAAEEVERYNRELERRFGGDHCFDVSRILRLPGTINLPDARKIRQGRRPALATVVEFNDTVYPLSAFAQAPPLAAKAAAVEKAAPESARAVAGLADLDEWSVDDRCKVIIAQGRHPDEGPKRGDDSRSAWLFDVVCHLVRKGVPEGVILGVLTDKRFRISESVLEAKSSERYARRQIARAREHENHPALPGMNERYFVVGNTGGRCLVAEEQWCAVMRRHRLSFQSFSDFRNRYRHEWVAVGGKPKRRGDWWLDNERRRQVDQIVFAPMQEVENAYNLWRGFAVEPRPGDCSKFLAHLHDNVCSGNDQHYRYLMGWLARMIQRPDTPGEVAVVMRGNKGTGKGKVAQIVGSLLGRHYLTIANPQHLVGRFNAHLHDTVFLFADESFFAGDKSQESVLKALITEPMFTLEQKFKDAEPTPNYTHILMASNDDWIIRASQRERRYFVLDVASTRLQDHAYFAAIDAEADSGGREALLHVLQNWDLSGFNVRAVPQTRALQEQKEMSLGPIDSWWFHKLLEGDLLPGKGWPREVEKSAIRDDFLSNMAAWQVRHRGTETILGRYLHRMIPLLGDVRRPGGRHYVVADLAECRQRWADHNGDYAWPADADGSPAKRIF